jgi:pyrroline-5-carboxylate reductase
MQVGFIGSGNMAGALARVAEGWADAAIRHGMPAARAATLVTEIMAGTAAVLTKTDTLTSPGGSTATDAVVRA